MSRLFSQPIEATSLLVALEGSVPRILPQVIEGVCALDEDLPNHLTFSTSHNFQNSRSLVIAPVRDDTVIFSVNPRQLFVEILNYIQQSVGFEPFAQGHISETALIEEGAYVDPKATVGHGTIIERGVTIREGVQIGSGCHIHSGVIIGDSGFGFTRSDDGTISHFPHLGGVQIGDRVVLGSNSTVAAGALAPTVLEDDVKTDNLVHIGHNCHIQSGVLIAACAEISGSVSVGRNAWLGPNCSIIDGCTIGNDAFIGLGAVVIRSVDAYSVVAGNPAKFIRRKGDDA